MLLDDVIMPSTFLADRKIIEFVCNEVCGTNRENKFFNVLYKQSKRIFHIKMKVGDLPI